jgi:hypothetical protein
MNTTNKSGALNKALEAKIDNLVHESNAYAICFNIGKDGQAVIGKINGVLLIL